jgi:prepilin-type N-terminal cleavage/methylation domain-containing protein
MRHFRKTAQAGFTIIELMIATIIFSIILIVITSGILHFTTDYYKGVNASSTQTAARNIANVIAQNLQYGGGKDDYTPSIGGATQKRLCIGSARIDYNLGNQLGKGIPGLDYGVVISSDTCGHVYPPIGTSHEYLAPNMRIAYLDIQQNGGGSSLYTIDVVVAYGDIDLLCTHAIVAGAGSCGAAGVTLPSSIIWATQGKQTACKVTNASQFCAVSHLTTQVVSRFQPSS